MSPGGRRVATALALLAGVGVTGFLLGRVGDVPPSPEPSPSPAVSPVRPWVGPFRPTVDGPLVDGRTGTVLLVPIGATDLYVVAVDAGLVRISEDAAPGTGPIAGLVSVAGGSVALRDGTAWYKAAWPGPPPLNLGPSEWLLTAADGASAWLGGRGAIRRVDTAGREVERHPFPVDGRPVVALPRAFVVLTGGERVEASLFVPGKGLRALPKGLGGPETTVMNASGLLLAWVDTATSPPSLHLTDVPEGADRTLVLPEGAGPGHGSAAYSPDGSRLAVSTGRDILFVDVARGTAERIPGSETAYSECPTRCLTWSPSGEWLFFLGRFGGGEIGAYRVAARRAWGLRLETMQPLPGLVAVAAGAR